MGLEKLADEGIVAQFSKNTEACFILLIIHSCQPDLGLPVDTSVYPGKHGRDRELDSTRVGVGPEDGAKQGRLRKLVLNKKYS